MAETEESRTGGSLVTRIGQFIPAILLVVLFVIGIVTGAHLSQTAIIALIGIQILWLALWYGLPWVARQAGGALGERT